jgi:hypothetical protein
LPDGLFSNQKYQLGKNFQGLRLENVDLPIPCPFGIFYGYFGYFVTIRYILCSFGTFFPVLVSYTNENLATLVTPLFANLLLKFDRALLESEPGIFSY